MPVMLDPAPSFFQDVDTKASCQMQALKFGNPTLDIKHYPHVVP